MSDWYFWHGFLREMVLPVLSNLSVGQLHCQLPYECASGCLERARLWSMNEAFGRTLCGVAPFLESGVAACQELQVMARAAIGQATDPCSGDYCGDRSGELSRHRQFLVDAAFFAEGLLRAPVELFGKLSPRVQSQVHAYLVDMRQIVPHENNWLLFSGMIETALHRFYGDGNPRPVVYALQRMNDWYKGDGMYGDGPAFAWDYYNSFVIHPMILDILRHWPDLPGKPITWETALRRSLRYGVILEHLIMPDGRYPVLGRSMCYRCGAFHHLANLVWLKLLPPGLTWGQLRGAMTEMLRRVLSQPGTYDERGWLTIGACGHQPGMGESYISTGSLYLASTSFLPLGLPPEDEFWTSPLVPWTQRRIWNGTPGQQADHKLEE